MLKPRSQPFNNPLQNWQEALLPFCRSPESYPANVIYYDKNYVCITDLYPKSKLHFLIMPRRVPTELSLLTKHDIPMLKEIINLSEQIIKNHCTNHVMRIGFHAVPSLKQLHLHLISHDFISDSLKIKKHYLSFTTAFFKNPEEIIRLLEQDVDLASLKFKEPLLKGDLECHHCRQVFKTMPALKKHLESVE
jgi:aprataxin